MLVFCSKRLKLHTSIIIKLKDSVQRLLWFQTNCNRKCFVKKAHALNSRLQHDKEQYVTICSYCHTNLKISIANDDFWKEAKHFCLDVNTNFCSQFFVGRHFDFVNIQKFTMVKWEWTHLCSMVTVWNIPTLTTMYTR